MYWLCRIDITWYKKAQVQISLWLVTLHVRSFAGNGNDQNFQGGYLPKFVGQGGGYFGFSAQGGIYPLWKNRKFGF